MHHPAYLCGAIVCTLLLSACGGGGSGSIEEERLATGRLIQSSANGPITYTTVAGWRVAVDSGAVTIAIPATLSASGAFAYASENTQEKLGGLHIKDWDDSVRSLMLPGGTKLTLRADAAQGTMQSVDIYDGNESHQVDPRNNTILHSSTDGTVAATRASTSADGETAYLQAWPEGALLSGSWDGFLFFQNLYVQGAADDGTLLEKDTRIEPLGRMFGVSEIDDYYDDPRLDGT